MKREKRGERGLRGLARRVLAPLPASVPPKIREQLTMLQFERLHTLVPLLCAAVIAGAVAMALAVLGELPLWQQLGPPAIIVGAMLAMLFVWLRGGAARDAATAERRLTSAVVLAAGLGLVAGLWCVNAFRETEQYRCVVAPAFIAITALAAAGGLTSVPKAAIAAMVTALAPIIVAMLLFDNLGLRAMAFTLMLVVALQAWLVRSKFAETVRMLELQDEIGRLAETDPLTGLSNRRGFMRKLEESMAAGETVTLAMVDLDGFKPANDLYGHHAGDRILQEVAARMETVCNGAACIARLGGDEFAVLFDARLDPGEALVQADAIRAVIALPYALDGNVMLISASVGTAGSPADGETPDALLIAADKALYAEKALRGHAGQRKAA